MKKVVLILAMVMGVTAMQAQTRTAIKLAELPKAVTDNISMHHKGWVAQEAFRVDTKSVLTYEVVVKKAASEMNLIYDKDGKYLKMEPHKLAVNSPAKPASESKPTASTAKPTASSAKPTTKK